MEGVFCWLKLSENKGALTEEQNGHKWPLSPTAVYPVVFLRAFSRAVTILWSHGGVLLPGLMSSALSRAERAVIGRAALGDD